MLPINEEKHTVIFFIKNLSKTDILDASNIAHVKATAAAVKSVIGLNTDNHDRFTAVAFCNEGRELISESRWLLDRILDQYSIENDTRITRPQIIDEAFDYKPTGFSCVNRHIINKGWSESVR